MRLSILISTTIMVVGLAGCNRSQDTVAAGDAANGNLAPADQAAPVPTQTSAVSTPPAPQRNSAPPPPAYAGADTYDDASYYDSGADSYAPAVEASDPPPPLPEYDQPPCPGDDYLWTPGYWDYANTGYYWVPGAWVMAPYVGALWTPPWWGYHNRVYVRHAGYWGPHIGFYGGINYGFGYTGRGYYGAYWNGGTVVYNRSVTNVNTTVVHNVYNYSVPRERGQRISYNGGNGGIAVRPTVQETAALRDPRTPPVPAQIQHARDASGRREQFSDGGHTRPSALVAARPLPTDYRAPAPRAPERAILPRPAEPAPSRTAQPGPPPSRPNQPFDSRQPVRQQPVPTNPVPSNAERIRPERQQQAAPVPRPAVPEARPSPPENRADRAQRPVPQVQPAPIENRANRAPRPVPQGQPGPPENRADRAPRQIPQIQQQPPQAHPAPPEMRTDRVGHPAPPPQATPQARPAPQENHADRMGHPGPQQPPTAPERQSRPPQAAPQAHPVPQPERHAEPHPNSPPPPQKKGQ